MRPIPSVPVPAFGIVLHPQGLEVFHAPPFWRDRAADVRVVNPHALHVCETTPLHRERARKGLVPDADVLEPIAPRRPTGHRP